MACGLARFPALDSGSLIRPKASAAADNRSGLFLLISQQGAPLEAIHKTPFTATAKPRKSIPSARSRRQTRAGVLPSVASVAGSLRAGGDTGVSERRTLRGGGASDRRGEAGQAGVRPCVPRREGRL